MWRLSFWSMDLRLTTKFPSGGNGKISGNYRIDLGRDTFIRDGAALLRESLGPGASQGNARMFHFKACGGRVSIWRMAAGGGLATPRELEKEPTYNSAGRIQTVSHETPTTMGPPEEPDAKIVAVKDESKPAHRHAARSTIASAAPPTGDNQSAIIQNSHVEELKRDFARAIVAALPSLLSVRRKAVREKMRASTRSQRAECAWRSSTFSAPIR